MKRAVLVGIDDYDTFPRLTGCVTDVQTLLPLLERNDDGSGNFECQTWTSDQEEVTRDRLLEAIDQALAPDVDSALFFFAGHGIQVRNDLVLAAQDGRRHNPGVSLTELLGAALGADVREILIVLDCCFAGGAGVVPQFGTGVSALRRGLSILAASRDDQAAAELGQGLFTTYLCDALRGGAADVQGVVTLASAYAYLSESFGAFEQRPTFKANVTQLQPLRRCGAAVSRGDLQELPRIFAKADSELQLDPTYEPTAKVKKKNPDNERVFGILQRCRAGGLVEPIGVPHLWTAAMEGKSARLTALGRHYWRIAKRNKLQP